MLKVVLYQPEIPPNTGNIIRLCANTGVDLDLVGPLGFVLDDKRLRRAGLDYRDLACVHEYPDWSSWLEQNADVQPWAFSTKGSTLHSSAPFRREDALLFGPESRGLPAEVLEYCRPDRILRLPMQAESRSLNLSNAVAVGLYEALRQLNFPGLA